MTIENQIDQVIRNLEQERGIRVLFACESGSRAWGFASPDSDYDLRFIYAHPQAWYLDLQKQSDVIDLMLPNDLDLAGWDFAKTLRLFATCNLALNEWLDSPIVYWQCDGFRDELSSLIPHYFKPRKALHHYLSMAKGTATDHFDGSLIKIKKHFYILRPLFACYWIESKQTMPPTLFQCMLDSQLAESKLLEAIASVQTQKETANEGEAIETPSIIFDWIQQSITRFESIEHTFPSGDSDSWAPLNSLFAKWVGSST